MRTEDLKKMPVWTALCCSIMITVTYKHTGGRANLGLRSGFEPPSGPGLDRPGPGTEAARARAASVGTQSGCYLSSNRYCTAESRKGTHAGCKPAAGPPAQPAQLLTATLLRWTA